MKLISSALVLLFLSSCSTSWSDLFEDENSEKRNKKLMKSFGAEEEVLKKFTSAYGKIMPKKRSGACSKHQRIVTRAIKNARIMGFMPFVVE